MDIVDNNVNVNNYDNDKNKRHVSSSNNIVFWLKLDVDYINDENELIINKYKKTLNQKDINTIIKCIKYNINIVPILYQLDNDDINLLVNESFECINGYMIKLLNGHTEIDHNIVVELLPVFCESGRLDVVKYLYKKNKLSKQNFQSDNNNQACRFACANGYINVVKYLHREIGLTAQDFQSFDNYACRFACVSGHVVVVKYLHQEIGLTEQDFQSDDNWACKWACSNGHINVVEYLHKIIGLTKEDFQLENNYACRQACENGHIDVVKYLHKNIGLTKNDFQHRNNDAYYKSVKYNHNAIVEYLLKEIKLFS